MFAAFSNNRGKSPILKLRDLISRLPITDPPSIILKAPFPENKWQDHMAHASYCPCPHGDTPSTRRFFNAVLSGCGIFDLTYTISSYCD
jgi:hypothetical protein